MLFQVLCITQFRFVVFSQCFTTTLKLLSVILVEHFESLIENLEFSFHLSLFLLQLVDFLMQLHESGLLKVLHLLIIALLLVMACFARSLKGKRRSDPVMGLVQFALVSIREQRHRLHDLLLLVSQGTRVRRVLSTHRCL